MAQAEEKELTKADFKRIREHLKMTQEEFAAKLGYSSNITIAYKESGKRGITSRDKLMLSTEIVSLGIVLR